MTTMVAKGSTMSEESRAKMRAAWDRRRASGQPHNRTGQAHTVETRRKISEATRAAMPRGADLPSYRDGKLAERRGERFSTPYKRWRFAVMARDGFACRCCGDARGGNLHAHHLLGFAAWPELRIVVPNGLTLCDTCHRSLHRGLWTPEVPEVLLVIVYGG